MYRTECWILDRANNAHTGFVLPDLTSTTEDGADGSGSLHLRVGRRDVDNGARAPAALQRLPGSVRADADERTEARFVRAWWTGYNTATCRSGAITCCSSSPTVPAEHATPSRTSSNALTPATPLPCRCRQRQMMELCPVHVERTAASLPPPSSFAACHTLRPGPACHPPDTIAAVRLLPWQGAAGGIHPHGAHADTSRHDIHVPLDSHPHAGGMA